MTFQKKRPPIRIKLTKSKFNLLVGILYANGQKKTASEKNISKELKEKLLQYSIPIVNDNSDEFIEIGLFVSEISKIIEELLCFNIDVSFETDYYNLLIEQRNKFAEKMKNS